MLERSSLTIQSWTKAAAPDGNVAWTRFITNADGAPLGFARIATDVKTSWFSWLRRLRFDVFETDDASHLMTLTRSWGIARTWDVDDAEGRYIGRVNKTSIHTDEGHWLCCAHWANSLGQILDAEGNCLAQVHRSTTGQLTVTFSPSATVNPFVRMLILGWTLALEQPPK